MATRRTYAEARDEILDYLHDHDWKFPQMWRVAAVPHATSPDGSLRLWFKAQAVHATQIGPYPGARHERKDARAIAYDLDIRKLDGPEFLAYIARRFPGVTT